MRKVKNRHKTKGIIRPIIMVMNKDGITTYLPSLIGGFVLAVLFILSGLIPINSLWGFNHLKYLPVYFLPVFAVLFILALLPGTAGLIHSFIKRALDSFTRMPLSFRIFLVLIVSAGLFYLLRVHVHSLGDGYQRIYQIENDYFYYHTEPLDFSLHAVLYRLLKLFGVVSGEVTYTLFSVIAGTAFVVTIYLFHWPKKMNLNVGGLVKLIIICFGGTQLFFGYVESYSLYYIFSLLYILFAMRFIITGKRLLVTSLLLGLACASHLTALIFVPSFVYLVALNFRKTKGGGFVQRIIPIIIVIIPVLGLLIQEYRLREALEEYIPSVSAGLLPFFSTTEYSMLSPMHLFDILNELLLIAPIALVLLILLAFRRGKADKENPGIFLLIVSVCSLIMLFAIDPKLGLARDWDLLAIPAAAIGAAITIFALVREHSYKPPASVKLSFGLMALLFLSGWVFANSSVTGQLNRAEDLLKLSEKGRGYGYELLYYYYRHEAKDDEKALQLLNSITGEAKNARVYSKIAGTELDLGRQDDALKSIKKGLEIDGNFTELHLMAGTIWANRGRADYGLPYFLKALSLEPYRKDIYYDVGSVYYKLDSIALALAVYKDVIDLYPDDAMAYFGVGNMFRLLKQYDSASYYVQQGLRINPGIAEGYQILNAIKREMSP